MQMNGLVVVPAEYVTGFKQEAVFVLLVIRQTCLSPTTDALRPDGNAGIVAFFGCLQVNQPRDIASMAAWPYRASRSRTHEGSRNTALELIILPQTLCSYVIL